MAVDVCSALAFLQKKVTIQSSLMMNENVSCELLGQCVQRNGYVLYKFLFPDSS